MKHYRIFLLLLLLGSCTLNADQEKSLNKAHVDYAAARNSGDVVKFAAFTHPSVISHYKQLGDSVFKQKFDLPVDIEHIQDGSVIEIAKEDKTIHARIDYLNVFISDYSKEPEEFTVIAISEDEGVTWFILEQQDYYDDVIINPETRLLDNK